MKDLHLSSDYENFVRMIASDFEFLINLVGPEIVKTKTRKPIWTDLYILLFPFTVAKVMLQHMFLSQSFRTFIPRACAASCCKLFSFF